MLRISIAFFYGCGANFRPLSSFQQGAKVKDVWAAAYSAEQDLENLFGTAWFGPAVKSSYAPGQKLLAALKEITAKTDFTADLGFLEAHGVTSSLQEFEGAVKADLAVADAYFVTAKGGYDTTTLITNADALFPVDLGLKVMGAIPDVRDAGRCLAYELGTAAGFHVIRALEAVLRSYWDAVTGGKPKPKQRNMGVYLQRMEDGGYGDKKVLATLRQIKDLHRNGLIHPEETLTVDDAIGLFGIARSAIGAMLKEIPLPPAIAKPVAGIGGP